MKSRVPILASALLLAWFAIPSKLWAFSPIAAIGGVAIGSLSLIPLAIWVSQEIHTLPTLQIYLSMHIPGYVIPLFSIDSNNYRLPVEVLERCTLIILTYLIILLILGTRFERMAQHRRRKRQSVLDRQITNGGDVGIAWGFLTYSLLGTAAITFNYLPNLGSYYRYFQTSIDVSEKVAIFLLFTALGEGLFNKTKIYLLFSLLAILLTLEFSTAFLISGTLNLLTAIFAYTNASRRIPWISCAIGFLALAFLHAGKAEVRGKYWTEGKIYNENQLNLTAFYSSWFQSSEMVLASELSEFKPREGLLERTSLLRWLLLVASETPSNKPHLDGLTYKTSFSLFVPRIFWPDKPDSLLPTFQLAYEYGVQTWERAQNTSITLGQIAEAWANYGWLGVFGVALFLSLFLNFPAFVGAGRPAHSLGLLVGLPALTASYNIDTSIGPLLHAWTLHTATLFVFLRIFSKKPLPVDAEPDEQIVESMPIALEQRSA